MKWSEVLQAVKSLIIIFSILTASFKLDKIIDALGKFIERIFLIPSIIKRKRLENERYECFTNIINDLSLSPNIKEDMLRSMLKDSMQLQKEDPHKQPHTLPPERDDNSNENEKALHNLVSLDNFRKKE